MCNVIHWNVSDMCGEEKRRQCKEVINIIIITIKVILNKIVQLIIRNLSYTTLKKVSVQLKKNKKNYLFKILSIKF